VRVGLWFFPSLPARRLVDVIVAAEEAGADEVWLGDEGPAREPFTVLAAAAVRTERIRLGVAVTNPYVRPPGVTATIAQSLAELSDGRFSLGVGAGGHLSLAPFGLAPDRPLAGVERLLRACRDAEAGRAGADWAPGPVTVSGLAVPLYVGARRERLNRLASRAADGVFLGGMATRQYGAVLDWARSEGHPQTALYPSVAFGAAAVEENRPQMIFSLLAMTDAELDRLGVDRAEAEAATTALATGDEAPARALLGDERLEEVLWSGGPREIGVRLARLGRAHGADAVGVALVQSDLERALPAALETLAAARAPAPGE
jgi:5,10-methylenetetrahydromethanopterin reductase